MSVEVVKKLKPFVKAFSVEIPTKYKHGDEVCIGGEVKKINDFTDLFDDVDGFAYFNIDDGLGTMMLSIPKEIYKEIIKQYDITEGMMVLAEGKIMRCKGRINTPDEIICWNLCPLPTEKE